MVIYLRQHRLRFTVIAAAIFSALTLGLSQTAASALTFNTMRPYANTAYCVADDSGGGGYVSLVNPCNQGSFEAWSVEGSSYLGNHAWQQIQNEATDDCLQTAGYEVKLATAPCNGDEAQAWLELYNGSWTVWQSPYQHNGTYLCADASAQYGVRAWDCNGTEAQYWDGPQ